MIIDLLFFKINKILLVKKIKIVRIWINLLWKKWKQNKVIQIEIARITKLFRIWRK
jgi:hypothetical protein